MAVLGALGTALARLPGLRPAEPGEFTRRAFLNGRLDLTAAEGIADLVDASTRAQARQAIRQMEGGLGRLLEGWRADLLRALALVEAEIDFGAEEAEVGSDLLAAERPALEAVRRAMAGQLADAGRGERLRAGLTVAVTGPPNAGKSSLVNLLACRDVAIVTPFAGTTRDVLEVALDLDGWPLTVLDTAGLRETEDPIEREGVARALRRAAGADLRLLVLDAQADAAADLARHGAGADLVVLNKQDLATRPPALDTPRPVIAISCITGAGVDRLLEALAAAAAHAMDTGGCAVLTRERHRAALGEASLVLARCLDAPAGTELGLLAEDLRLAARAVGRVTGRVDVEAVLDEVFARFCIGK
jgi:tRNA modification GTPase